MQLKLELNGTEYSVDLDQGMDISIPLSHQESPIAFYAPAFESTPYESGDFIGALECGSPVNFYNVKINPHGNGTHTESMLHVDTRGLTIDKCLKSAHHLVQLITLHPSSIKQDRIVTLDSLADHNISEDISAIAIRTTPNSSDKLRMNYSGSNPCYLDYEVTAHLRDLGIDHLLIDQPSVDREEDGGELRAHKTWWNTESIPRLHATITEMIYVPNSIQDGLYLLNLNIAPWQMDASPSRPTLYHLHKIK